MRKIHSESSISIPSGVTVSVKSRNVTVTGPRGVLTRSFKHLACDIRVFKKKIQVEVWFGNHKHIACIRTVCTHIANLITGVTKGFEYKMRLVYAHFPVTSNISSDGKTIQINNYLGEKLVRTVHMIEGVNVRASDAKDEIILTGNNLESVSQSAAKIHHCARVTDKDIRKFLDGVYVSEKGTIGGN